jgi:YesN/AraC family two-component response regulator
LSSHRDFFKNVKEITLLYVEDDDNTREELVFFLENKVKKLYIAKNGQEGFELFEKYQPDMIITDIQMPVMNGIKMVKLIKQVNKNIPIVFITAFNDADNLYEAIKLNITNYLTKPTQRFFSSIFQYNRNRKRTFLYNEFLE